MLLLVGSILVMARLVFLRPTLVRNSPRVVLGSAVLATLAYVVAESISGGVVVSRSGVVGCPAVVVARV